MRSMSFDTSLDGGASTSFDGGLPKTRRINRSVSFDRGMNIISNEGNSSLKQHSMERVPASIPFRVTSQRTARERGLLYFNECTLAGVHAHAAYSYLRIGDIVSLNAESNDEEVGFISTLGYVTEFYDIMDTTCICNLNKMTLTCISQVLGQKNGVQNIFSKKWYGHSLTNRTI